MYIDKSFRVISEKVRAGKVKWQSPSNLALVKYWGKTGAQIPGNPSLSLTLQNAHTTTSITYKAKEQISDTICLRFFFEGKSNVGFEERIKRYFSSLTAIYPFLKQLDMEIHSSNSFPHSTGIASSASAFSALALCLCSIEKKLFDSPLSEGEFMKKASYLARLGSGSACRSIYPVLGLWGKSALIKGSSDEYAVPLAENIDEVYHTMKNAILIVTTEEKQVSSSLGHRLMDTHPYRNVRYEVANDHLRRIWPALQNGDLEVFGSVVESEALGLHSLMMSSSQGYILKHPNTIHILQLVREFRKTTSQPLYFSMDAGPNVHLLYPKSAAGEVKPFIRSVLLPYCAQSEWIDDRVGNGPQKLEQHVVGNNE